MVTHQLQVERRTGKVRRPETDVLPLSHATNHDRPCGYLVTGTSADAQARTIRSFMAECLATTLLKDEETARDNHLLACNFAKYSPIKKISTGILGNKLFSIWLLTTQSHLKYATTLSCNLLLIACFLSVMFHNAV